MAKVKVRVKEIVQLDENSVGVMLDFDNVREPGKVIESINAIRDWSQGSIDFWDVLKIMITVWKG